MDKSTMFGILKLEIGIICPLKYDSEIKGNKLILTFKSQKSANKAYNIIRIRYNNERMWDCNWKVKLNNLNVEVIKS